MSYLTATLNFIRLEIKLLAFRACCQMCDMSAAYITSNCTSHISFDVKHEVTSVQIFVPQTEHLKLPSIFDL